MRPENHVHVLFLFPLSTQAHLSFLSLFRNKAVSDGAISFYLDHFVRTRVSKVTYGTNSIRSYDSSDPEHVTRQGKAFMSVSGSKRIGNLFSIILPKVRGLVVPMSWEERILIVTVGGDFRIPECQKRKSLGKVISVYRRIRTSLRMRRLRFGVIVGPWRSLGGWTLILVRFPHSSSLSSR